MAGFTIPNTPDAYNQNQAEPDSLDFQILGNAKNAVISGLEVSPAVGGGTAVKVSAGEARINGIYYSISDQNSISLTSYSTAPFFDLIVARVSNGSLTITVLTNGITTNPRLPSTGTAVNQVNFNTDVVLAAVWRDSGAPTSVHIVDKRFIGPSSLTRIVGATPTSGGSDGDIFVNTNWNTGTNSSTSLDSPVHVRVGGVYYNLASWPSNNNIVTSGSIAATGTISGSNLGTWTPVQQGGGTSQLTNKIYIGWLSSNRLGLQIDSSNYGYTWPIDVGSIWFPSKVNGSATSTSGAKSYINPSYPTQTDYTGNDNTLVVRDGSGNIETYNKIYAYGNWTPYGQNPGVPGETPPSSASFAPQLSFLYKNPSTGATSTFFYTKQPLLGNGGSAKAVYIGADGELYASGASSQRYKENVAQYSWDVSKILQIEAVSFTYKKTRSEYNNGSTAYGVIAEQVDQLGLSDLLYYNQDGEPEGFKYDTLPLALLDVIKGLVKRIEALEAKK